MLRSTKQTTSTLFFLNQIAFVSVIENVKIILFNHYFCYPFVLPYIHSSLYFHENQQQSFYIIRDFHKKKKEKSLCIRLMLVALNIIYIRGKLMYVTYGKLNNILRAQRNVISHSTKMLCMFVFPCYAGWIYMKDMSPIASFS